MKHALLSLSLFVFMFFAHPAFAAEWTALSTGDAQSFRAITQSGDRMVVAGNGGKIFYSADEGKSWTKAFDAQGVTFFDFATLPNGDLLAIGSGGINKTSSDHGLTWSTYSFGIASSVYGVDVKTTSGASTGYLVGASGTYRSYVSQAGNWEAHSLGLTTDLWGVEDRGDGTGWLVGADGRIFKVISGGNSWAEITSNTKETLNAVRFVSATKGFIVGTMGTILKTTDGGSTWNLLPITGLTNQALYSLDILGNQIVITGDKILLDSSDAGETWHVKTFDGTMKKFFGAYIKDATHIYAVGSDDDATSLIYQLVETPVTPPPTTPPTPAGTAPQGSLMKLVCSSDATLNDPCKAVYFYATDGKRHAFPNDKVYFTWYADFSSVKEVSADFLASLALGKNVTYHPGTKMVKFQTSPTVYAVAKGGVLRPISSESVALSLYGVTWNKQIDDISDVFFKNYSIGDPINTSSDYNPDQARASVASISENF